MKMPPETAIPSRSTRMRQCAGSARKAAIPARGAAGKALPDGLASPKSIVNRAMPRAPHGTVRALIRLLGGRISARTVPWGALGIALFTIDLWLASPSGKALPAAPLAGIAAFLAEPAHWRILVDLLGIAVSGGIFIVPLYVLLQWASPRTRRARAVAANNIVNSGAMVIAAMATMALLAAGVSVPGLFLLTGVLTLPVALFFWRLQARLPSMLTELAGEQS